MEIVPQLVATDLTLNKPSLEILLSCLATQCHVHGQRKAYRLWLRESIMIIVNLALANHDITMSQYTHVVRTKQ